MNNKIKKQTKEREVIAPRKKGFNEHKVIGDYTIIYLRKRDGDIFETLIDTEDLDYIKSLDLHWSALWCEGTQSYYAKASEYYTNSNGKRKAKTRYLHRIILKVTKEMDIEHIDHINHNTLDNRKENLRASTINENSTNRNKLNTNNSSGYRNVSKLGKWWGVQLQINGKNTVLKKFPLDQLDEAGEYAKKMRSKYYGEFQGDI